MLLSFQRPSRPRTGPPSYGAPEKKTAPRTGGLRSSTGATHECSTASEGSSAFFEPLEAPLAELDHRPVEAVRRHVERLAVHGGALDLDSSLREQPARLRARHAEGF